MVISTLWLQKSNLDSANLNSITQKIFQELSDEKDNIQDSKPVIKGTTADSS